MSELELTAELLVDGATPTAPVISPDGRWVAYVVTTPGVKQRRVSALWVVPADTSSPPRRLTAGTAWDRLPRWAPDSGSLLFVSDGQLHRIRLDGGGAEALTSWRAGIDDHLPLAEGRLVGGPYGRYADEFMGAWWPLGQWLATAGYAVFLPNPRGSEGRGDEFAAMVEGAVGTDEWTDILTGIDLLIAEGVADPGRLGIGGWSHGGFMAGWAVGQAYFHRALCRFGVENEFVVYPREGHPILERNHQLDLLRRTRAWFARWLALQAP